MTVVLDVLELLCACGFLRQAIMLSTTCNSIGAALPTCTGRHIYRAAAEGRCDQLATGILYSAGDTECRTNIFNYMPIFAHLSIVLWRDPTAPWWRDVNFKDLGNTPIAVAALFGSTSAVRLLLSVSEINPDKKSALGIRPIQLAAQHGHLGVLDLLLRDVRVDPGSLAGGVPPWQCASENGHHEAADLILDAMSHETLGQELRLASRRLFTWTQYLEVLLTRSEGLPNVLHQVNRTTQSEKMWTGFACAAWAGDVELMRVLLTIPGRLINRSVLNDPYHDLTPVDLSFYPRPDLNEETRSGRRDVMFMLIRDGALRYFEKPGFGNLGDRDVEDYVDVVEGEEDMEEEENGDDVDE